jgi:hypothetical protein
MAQERPVRLVLDASLLLDPVGGGGTGEVAPALRPGAEELLRRLRYSSLAVVWALLLSCSCDLRLGIRIRISGLVSCTAVYRRWLFAVM